MKLIITALFLSFMSLVSMVSSPQAAIQVGAKQLIKSGQSQPPKKSAQDIKLEQLDRENDSAKAIVKNKAVPEAAAADRELIRELKQLRRELAARKAKDDKAVVAESPDEETSEYFSPECVPDTVIIHDTIKIRRRPFIKIF